VFTVMVRVRFKVRITLGSALRVSARYLSNQRPSLSCGQSRLRPLASQPGISHIEVPAGVVLRKQLYSGRIEPLDDDDGDESVTNKHSNPNPNLSALVLGHTSGGRWFGEANLWLPLQPSYSLAHRIEYQLSVFHMQ